LVATFKIPKGGEALCVSEGVDRDRAIDESGNQIAVFGRVGAGPLSLADQQRMYLRPNGRPWTVFDAPRDWNTPDARSREIEFHLRIADFYGHSLHPAVHNFRRHGTQTYSPRADRPDSQATVNSEPGAE
jgi:hypothetical protein